MTSSMIRITQLSHIPRHALLLHHSLSASSIFLPNSNRQNCGFLSQSLQDRRPCYRLPRRSRLAPGSGGDDGVSPSDEDGISLGTMKLPVNTDLARFETLLFQWANSLCQGANLPLPVPLKVDKIPGGVRLGFITMDDGKTEVEVHIDCLVLPATGGSAPMFRATRNGPLKNQIPPGEPRIMTSLQEALKKSVKIAAV